MAIYIKNSVLKRLGLVISPKTNFFFSFLLGFSIRLVPEILSYPSPIGFDTIYYAARLKEGVLWYHWSEILTQKWLLDSLLIPIYRITNLSPTIILKMTSPILYGLNAGGICLFAKNFLKWETSKSRLASVLFAFHIASLRISWDLYRNVLGLALLLFALSLIPEVEEKKKTMCFIVLSILTVLSHELTAVTLLAAIFWAIVRNLRGSEKIKAFRLFLSLVPALILCLVGIYLAVYPIPYEIETNIIDAGDENLARLFGLFFLTDYLKVSNPIEHYSTYTELALHILSFFVFLYSVWTPLIIKGFFREKILDIWTALLLIGSFNALITPFSALLYWERWMIMLVYPFTFYATNGLEKVLNKVERRKVWLNFSKIIVAAMILMSVFFMVLPTNLAVYEIPTVAPYFPSTMQQNTIPLEDVEGTIKGLEYLNGMMNKKSCVLVHHAFLSWAELYLDKNHMIIYYAMNLTKAVEVAQKNEFKDIYLLWWYPNIGWYTNIRIPESFKLNHSSGRIGIYTYS